MKHYFKFDINKCTGCHACQIACAVENQLDSGINWRSITSFNEPLVPGIPKFNYSLSCNHCEIPLCKINCPADAYSKDEQTGIVTVDPDKCIGCKYCTWVCPYNAPKYNSSTSAIEKCNFCNERLEQNLKPACAAACPTNALTACEGDEDKALTIPQLNGFPEAGLKPAIDIIPLRKIETPVELSDESSWKESRENLESSLKTQTEISIGTEWSLFIFTFAAALLTAWFGAYFIAEFHLNVPVFITSCLAAAGISTFHLGRKNRLYRAPYNFTGSWISREIIMFSLFIAGAFIYLEILPSNKTAGWLTIIAGYSALFSMDRIYDFKGSLNNSRFHSGSVFLTGLLLLFILLNYPVPAIITGIMKLLMYTVRKVRFARNKIMLNMLRHLFGFILPGFLWIAGREEFLIYILFSVISGELIDRYEFYSELEFQSPQKKAESDLKIWIKTKIKQG